MVCDSRLLSLILLYCVLLVRHFLANDYAVLYLYRAFTCKPFERQLRSDNPLDWFSVSAEGQVQCDYHLEWGGEEGEGEGGARGLQIYFPTIPV